MDCNLAGSSVHGFFKQEYWSGLPCPPPGDLPDPGIKTVFLMSPALTGVFFTTSTTWEAPTTCPPSERTYLTPTTTEFSSVQCLTLYDPMNHSTPGLPVHHQLPEFTQTHVHRIGDAIQPSHLLSSPSLPAPNPSQHQGLFQWVSSSHEVAKVLEFQLQHQSFQPGLISFRMDWLDLLAVQGTLKSLLQHHSSKASILLVLSFLYSPTFTSIHNHWKNHSLD